jgi:hypothetical protein
VVLPELQVFGPASRRASERHHEKDARATTRASLYSL